MRNFTPEEAKRFRDTADDDSIKIIHYLEDKFEEQDKQIKIDRIINIIGVVFALIAAIATIASFFI